MKISDLSKAGLTDGEARVYMALLELGASSTGPIVNKSRVTKSILYQILDKLIVKGLVSYSIKDNTKLYQAEDPQKIIEYIEQREAELAASKNDLNNMLPELRELQKTKPKTSVRIYEGFKAVNNAYEHYYNKLGKGDTQRAFGVQAAQPEKYEHYYHQDHIKREKLGINSTLLVNADWPDDLLINRNSFSNCDCRRMPVNITTPNWVHILGDTVQIFHQTKDWALEIEDEEVAKTFRAYFDYFWSLSKPFKPEE